MEIVRIREFEALMSGAMLSYNLFKKADLRGVILTGAYMGDADFSQVNLMGVKFGNPLHCPIPNM